jgi:ATP-dependent DNA helicase RecG
MAALTDAQVLALMADLESDRVERTESTTNTDKFSEAVCAFANDFPNHRKPGYLLIGVRKDGRPSGLTVTERLLESLAGLRRDGNIQPLPAITVSKHGFEGGDVAVVAVEPALLPPVNYRGRVWIRVGPSKGVATEQEERILSERRSMSARSFDAEPCQGSAIEDLSLRLFGEYRAAAVADEIIAANHRTPSEQLAALRFFDLRSNLPTHAGLLLFGLNPRFFLPGAYVQFVVWPGTDVTDSPISEREVSGDLRSVVSQVQEIFRARIQIAVERTGGISERYRPDFPEVALSELFNNAIMHRDYQSNTPIRVYWFLDRVEIISPGGLVGEVTKETLETRSSYRNPIIAEAMKTLGYVNRYGSGIRLAQRRLAEAGHAPAIFAADDRQFAVTVPARYA